MSQEEHDVLLWLYDQFNSPMGVKALTYVREKWGVGSTMLDPLALQTHCPYAAAVREGYRSAFYSLVHFALQGREIVKRAGNDERTEFDRFFGHGPGRRDAFDPLDGFAG